VDSILPRSLRFGRDDSERKRGMGGRGRRDGRKRNRKREKASGQVRPVGA